MTTKNIMNEFEQLAKNPQQALQEYHEKQKAFNQHVEARLKDLPVRAQTFMQEQQQKILELTGDLTTALKNNPSDWNAINHIWFNFQAQQINQYLTVMNEQHEEIQEIVNNYCPSFLQTLKETIENNSLYKETKANLNHAYSNINQARSDILSKQYEMANTINKNVHKTVEKVVAPANSKQTVKSSVDPKKVTKPLSTIKTPTTSKAKSKVTKPTKIVDDVNQSE